ncbi:MAG: hypothetical protein ACXVNF_04755 [Neobacillus sp.]
MDRHYVDEYAFYYSRMLSPPKNSVKRLHIFNGEISESHFTSLLEKSFLSNNDKSEVEKELNKKYLGFSVIRPIRSAPIGRTIVARLPDEGLSTRQIWATNTHSVHLANLKLRVDGLAFQQQDAAVGACATAALWSTLVRTARHDGMRAPTPAEISDVATNTLKPGVRPLLTASTGLTIPQLSQAIRTLGFAPEMISARGCPEFFMITLHTYLLSGFPVLLALRSNGVGHAVTAVGFQTSSENPSLHTSFKVRSAGIRKVYVHDDRMGPYARAYIEPFPPLPEGEGGLSIDDGLLFEIEWGTQGESEKWLLDSAIAAVYPKLRLSVRSLISLAELMNGPVEKLVGEKQATGLRVDFRYERSGEYLSRLSGRIQNNSYAAKTVTTVALSRWCAVIRWYLNEKELIEFVYDTTDVVRDITVQNRELLKLAVCLDSKYYANIAIISKALSIQFI